jgi:hypothetical protein
MKKINTVLLAVTICCALGWTASAQRARVQWEYTAISAGLGVTDSLNRLGAEGWELVAVQPNGTFAVYILKRQK